MIALGGCAGFGLDESASRSVSLTEFSKPAPEGMILGRTPATTPAARQAAVGEADLAGDDPPAETAPRTVMQKPPTVAGGAAGPQRGATAEPSKSPPSKPAASSGTTTDPDGSERWLVDALVGQINGRPVFADEFLEPIAARLQEIARGEDRALARRQLISIVQERFQDWVNSELIISEAESNLTPEQQQGFFGWLKTMQEGTIASYAGNREEAREAMREDLGMDIDEFMRQRRDAALAQYLLDRKVKPRTIVAWRDIEREYRNREAEFNPPAKVSIGRLALDAVRDADQVAKVKGWIAEGKSFVEIADALKLDKGGIVVRVPLKAGETAEAAIEASDDIAPAVKAKLKGLAPGVLSSPIERGTSLTWLAVVEVKQDAGRSLFDPNVQMQLRKEIDGIRSVVERGRYIGRLRSRWVSDDINRIEERLLLIAFERYFR